MLNVRVHAAIAQQSHKMQLPLPSALHRLLEQRHLIELLVGNQQIDARDVHVHDAARPNIHVAHFAVAHLPLRQSDRRPGSLDQRVGKFLHQRVIIRFPRERNRVALRLRSISPSIQHCQYDRFRSLCHDFSLRSAIYGSASLSHFNFISHLERANTAFLERSKFFNVPQILSTPRVSVPLRPWCCSAPGRYAASRPSRLPNKPTSLKMCRS